MDALLEALAAGEVAPVYVLVGEEPFAIGTWLDAIRGAVVGREGDAWNSETFEGGDTTVERILSSARTLPMLGGRRLVVVRKAEALAAGDQARIAAYLADPSPTTTLVLVASKLDGRGKISATARRLGFLHKAEPLRERGTAAFVHARAAERRVRIEPKAVEALVEALGPDPSGIDDALERLALWVGEPARPIAAADVSACVAPHRQTTVFALVDAISAGDAKRALGTLAALLRDREPALLVLWWLSRQIRHLAAARSLRGAGDIAGALGVPPFVAEKLGRAAKSWSDEALRSALALLAQADLDLKGSRIPERLLLEALVLGLARKAGARRATSSASALRG